MFDVVLGDTDAMGRIQGGLREYEGRLSENRVDDWIPFIRFNGVYYYATWKQDGKTLTAQQLDQSQLETVLYRVAFRLDANRRPADFQIQDGDAAGLEPGTAIYSVVGYDPSVRLGAVVNDDVILLFERPLSSQTPGSQASAADSIEAVYSFVASMRGGSPLSPLFGDWPEDRAAIHRLALALETAVPITPTEHLEANDRGRFLRIRYRDGTELTVRRVARCEPWSDAKDSVGAACKGNLVLLNDTWWVEGTGMVKSVELGLWWEDMSTFMERICAIHIPKTIKQGEPVTVSVSEWGHVAQAPTMKLSLVYAGGTELELGEVPSSSSYFQGELVSPAHTPSGRYWLRVTSGDFSELVEIVQVEGNTSRLGTEDETPPARATPTPAPMPTVQRNVLEEPPRGAGVEIGNGYPYSLYVHCGVRDAHFDGRIWMADPMLSDGSGNPPSDWTFDDGEGVMEMVRDDLAVFTARSGRIIEFKPWPSDVEWRPCA